jgi:hypothetical protein
MIGRDVDAFLLTARRLGLVSTSSSGLEPGHIAAWNQKFGIEVGSNVVPWETLISIPRGSSVVSQRLAVGSLAREGSPLLEVSQPQTSMDCAVPDPEAAPSDARLRLRSNGSDLKIGRVVTHPRANGEAGYLRVHLVGRLAPASAELGIQFSGAGKEVLAAPLGAVGTDSSGEPIVIETTGEKSSQRTVRVNLGESAAGWVAIEGEGLEVGTEVLLFSPKESTP